MIHDLKIRPDHGLSPLARGTRGDAPQYLLLRWFIPAGAGNTEATPEIRAKRAVYPRWRGEHNFCSMSLTPIAGLSPLARGTLTRARVSMAKKWFIPAGAGNTWLPAGQYYVTAVYPRWRGEHCFVSRAAGVLRGLSPLARGTLVLRRRV